MNLKYTIKPLRFSKNLTSDWLSHSPQNKTPLSGLVDHFGMSTERSGFPQHVCEMAPQKVPQKGQISHNMFTDGELLNY